MHLNSGYAREARKLGRRFTEIFGAFDAVVSPSSSCVGTVRETLAMDNVFELSELLVQRLGVEDVGASFQARVAYHSDLSLLARDAGRRRATASAAQACASSSSSSCRAPMSAADSGGRSRSRTPKPRVRCSRTSAPRSNRPARKSAPPSTIRACSTSVVGSLAAARRFGPSTSPRSWRRHDELSGSRPGRAGQRPAADEPPQRDGHDPRETRQSRGGAARLGGAPRRREGDQDRRACPSPRVPAPVRSGGPGGRRSRPLGP